MSHIKLIANLLLIVFFIIVSSYFYYGMRIKKAYSEDYNVPIAETIISGNFLTIHSDITPFLYFPGSSHFILVPFVLLGFPNLFGLLSFILLFLACKKLGEVFGLNKYMSIIFAAGFCSTMSVVRTIGDQSIDKWLCFWFILSLILLEKPQKNFKYSLLIGFSFGMLIGTKYSGPLFFLALLPLYLKTLSTYLNPVRFFLASIVFTITGLFWYIRNFILEGNPMYPANLPFFKGWPNYTQQDWMLWRIPFNYPRNLIDVFNAFLSEYTIWATSGLLIVWFVITSNRKRRVIESKTLRIIYLIISTAFVSFMLPVIPPYKEVLSVTISNMRYIYILVILMMLAVFLIVDRYKKNSLLASVVLINAIPSFSYIPYQPKILIFCILLMIMVYSKRKWLL